MKSITERPAQLLANVIIMFRLCLAFLTAVFVFASFVAIIFSLLVFRCTVAGRFYYLYYISIFSAKLFDFTSFTTSVVVPISSSPFLAFYFSLNFRCALCVRVTWLCSEMSPNQSTARFNLPMFTLFDDKSNAMLSMDIEFQAITLPTTRINKGKKW